MTADRPGGPARPLRERSRLRAGAALAGWAPLTALACALVARLETIAGVADQGGLLAPTLAPLAILPLGSGWPFRIAAALIFGLGLVALLRSATRRTVGAGEISAAVAAGLALVGILAATGVPPIDGAPTAEPWIVVLLGEVGRSTLVLTWAVAAVLLVGSRRRAATADRTSGGPTTTGGSAAQDSGSVGAGGGTATLPVIGSPDDRSTKQ